MPRSLKDLPAHLKHYNTKPASNVAEGEKCIACWREFGTVDDPSNSNERPCHALRIQPCNHLIGSKCLEELIHRNMARCPLCVAPITVVSPVPHWIIWLLEHEHVAPLSLWLPIPVDQFDHLQDEKRFDILQNRLFDGKLSLYQQGRLWLYHMAFPLQLTMAAAAWILVTAILCLALEDVLGSMPVSWQRPKYLLLILGVSGDKIVAFLNWCVYTRLALYMRDLPAGTTSGGAFWFLQVITAIGARNFTHYAGFCVMLAAYVLTIVLSDIVYGAMVAILIFLGQ